MIWGLKGILFVILILIISNLVNATTNVYISPNSIQKFKGSIFTLNITINSTDEIYAVQARLKFDPSILIAISAVEGDFLKKDGASTFPVITINNSDGSIKIGNTRFGTQSGVRGAGSILIVTFNSTTSGNSDLILDSVKIADPKLNKTNSTETNGSVQISGSIYSPTNPMNVILVPSLAYKNTTLLCNASGSIDPNGDKLTYYYEFRTQTKILKPYSLSNIYLCSTNCTKNDNLTCYAKAYDSVYFSDETPSNSVLILNSAPTAPEIAISPDIAKIDNDLKCDIITPSKDIDGDSVNYRYYWSKNNIIQPGITGNIVDKSLLKASDLWVCNATPNDGANNGISDIAFKVIVASVPEARIIFDMTRNIIQVLGIPGDANITNVTLINETLRYDIKNRYLGKLSNYLIVDEYNNYLNIILYFPAKGGVQIWSLQYNSGIITTPANYLLTTKLKKTDISQTLKSGKITLASISYKAKTNITTISQGGIKITQNGTHLIELRTDKSVLNYVIN